MIKKVKLLIDISAQDSANIHYGMEVMSNLGMSKKFHHELLSVMLTMPEEVNTFIDCESNALLSPHITNREKVVAYFNNTLNNSFVTPISNNVNAFIKRSKMKLERIISIDAVNKGGEVFLFIYVQT